MEASWVPGVIEDTAGSLPYEFQPSKLSRLAVAAVRSLRMQDAENRVDRPLEACRRSGECCRR